MPGDGSSKTAPEVQLETRTKGERTRDRLLDLAYEAVIRKGVAATSIEELVEAAGITKSGFFYHFKDKTDLARTMLERYSDTNAVFIDEMIARARELNEDPLHGFLIFLKLYAETMEVMAERHPGCMVATVSFQDLAWDREAKQIAADNVRAWRSRFVDWLEEIAEAYPPKSKLPIEDLAEAILAFTYGGMTLAKALDDTTTIARQALMFRETVRIYFLGR
jgi:TetR/AcrR family transcriptional repressor of nem operon